jgi:hypothetical protein
LQVAQMRLVLGDLGLCLSEDVLASLDDDDAVLVLQLCLFDLGSASIRTRLLTMAS